MIRIEVTQDDIDQGCRQNIDNCPVARALFRASMSLLPLHLHKGRVFRDDIRNLCIRIGDSCMYAPAIICDFVKTFDDFSPKDEEDRKVYEELVHPFVFELPNLYSSEWKRSCDNCSCLFQDGELDEYGICKGCNEEHPE